MKKRINSICFLDTNILLSACVKDRESHISCLGILEKGLRGECQLFASGQIFREFLVVATRPRENNGLSMKPVDACSNISEFSRCIRLLDETDRVSRRLGDLIQSHRLSGRRIHDANVVATMQEHGVDTLITENGDDFKSFSFIQVLTPAGLIGGRG